MFMSKDVVPRRLKTRYNLNTVGTDNRHSTTITWLHLKLFWSSGPIEMAKAPTGSDSN